MQPGSSITPRMPRVHVLSSLTSAHWNALCDRHDIDPPYRQRARDIENRTLINSRAELEEHAAFANELGSMSYADDPIFVLGNWRSGTTHLHYLLCQDPQFTFVSREDCFRPYRLRPSVPSHAGIFNKRQVDNLPIEPWMPGEDEFAIATRSLCSPFIGFAFPRDAEYYDRFLTFDDASEAELKAWQEAMLWVVKKATLWNAGRRVILKSPPHTARLRLLLKIFPRSQFIHLTRDPNDSFRSLLQLVQTLGPGNTLQQIDDDAAVETCLRRHRILVHAIARDVKLVAGDRFVECAYEDLHRSPEGVLTRIYSKLGIGDYSAAKPHFQAYLNSQREFVPRRHPPLPDTISAALKQIALDVG